MSKKSNFILSILTIFICALMIINLARSFSHNQFFSFESLIDFMSGVNSVPVPNINTLTITADWGVFNFFRDFLNIFTTLLNIAIFFSVNVFNLILFAFQFVGLLFV